MQLVLQRLRIVCHVLVGLIFLEPVPALAQARSEEPRLDIARVVFSDTLVYIYYTLTGSPERTYRVSVTLRKKSDGSYSYTPVNMIGDVGSEIVPGENKMIIWNSDTEIPGGLKKDEYFFALAVDPEPESGSWIGAPLLLIGGAALVGAVALLLLTPKSMEVQPLNDFPAPPFDGQ